MPKHSSGHCEARPRGDLHAQAGIPVHAMRRSLCPVTAPGIPEHAVWRHLCPGVWCMP